MAASLGKIPTTSVRHLISALSRSNGLVLWNWCYGSVADAPWESPCGPALRPHRHPSTGRSSGNARAVARLAVVPVAALNVLDAVAGAEHLDIQLHQALGDELDHVPEQIAAPFSASLLNAI